MKIKEGKTYWFADDFSKPSKVKVKLIIGGIFNKIYQIEYDFEISGRKYTEWTIWKSDFISEVKE